ncbi:uncharacterized protein TNIN_412681 [Trichonephila inaurata madagascariensis]|uniref:Zinc finger protein n=1 Tax=Trichonephila inaurata madagascariensis TaxID=2747483 RepID=A0A8X7C541_9ARAC|nr:uncharacterized protein TNIN_412681 [Trichonephila inaurata madagascariensis]
MGRPKTFIPCYVCFKEFGSRSLTIHEPKCLERWRNSNKSLPVDKRTPTPVKSAGWNSIQDGVCSHCQASVSPSKRNEHLCSAKKLRSSNNFTQHAMTGVVKSDYSPKKGKENKNNSNHIPVPNVLRKNAKNEAKVEPKDKLDPIEKSNVVKSKEQSKQSKVDDSKVPEDPPKDNEESSSTSKRSVRPQTKILRRPTPNLKHPVIQVDSDDSSGDSTCSDKIKDDNPKRLKTGSESSDSTHKPKNFIIYNKKNVEKNTKNAPKERTSATAITTSIPNPCNSCNRSQAPERLHSHAKRDARGLMYSRKSPSLDIKMSSPQKKVPEVSDKVKTRTKESKTEQVQQNHKDSAIVHSASESSVVAVLAAKDTVLDSKDKCDEISCEESQPVVEPKMDLLDIMKPCYICEEEFKVSNLLLHESKCLEVSRFPFILKRDIFTSEIVSIL